MEDQDILDNLKKTLISYIEKNYRSIEEFCWDKELSKATVSNFLNSKKDFQLSTLIKIAKAMDKKIKITLK